MWILSIFREKHLQAKQNFAETTFILIYEFFAPRVTVFILEVSDVFIYSYVRHSPHNFSVATNLTELYNGGI
jgi:hypothetical protein